ncbi:MAG TPA: phosphoglycerate dehydrogenase [Acidimicrobiales bacterium]|jgi:D-3-phosphoglycerate dehydrogenase|nr:phosphoglycerate dehydrogenase [Acidimicrobiales bacterium]HMS88120.1 phosphoglycerate dehydrogenase [Acidimicrobiales bacterium]HRA33849.1 phosphoglycerate dehydrogenase [Acidimicrobiales bacterium]
MARVLVSEKIAEKGLDVLRAAGHEVDVQLDLTPETLLEAVKGAHALIIRSATTVTAEVLDAGTDLVVVGRAGIGLDNVDVAHATARGVMVVNAPQSNILSAAEQTMALLLAQARNIPQAHGALVQGRWERSKWEGVELADKTLAVIGLGRIGKLVAQRAMAFGMRIIAHDPFVSPERAQAMNIELVSLDEVAAQADFLTLHVAKTPDTIGLIGRDFLAKAKPSLRVINVARGGIVDEEALAEAIREGRIAGAALDVFAVEPTTESPLFALPSVVVAPHLGASTQEAQEKAGDTIAEQVALALAGEFVPFAVNVAAAEASETVRPFLNVAEQLGALFAGLSGELPDQIEIEYQGELAGYDTRILTLSVLKGLFSADNDQVSYVNAPQIATERGIAYSESATSSTVDWINLVSISGGNHQIAGTLVGLRAEPRLVQIDGHTVDVPPAGHLLVVNNDDRPGVIGRVGTVLGDAGVNIADMDVGRSSGQLGALMVISVSEAPSPEVVDRLRAADGVTAVAVIGR